MPGQKEDQATAISVDERIGVVCANPNKEKTMKRRMIIVSVSILLLLSLSPAIVLAEPPLNDVRENAIEITSLPFSDSLEMSQATWDDPGTTTCSPTYGNVWYRFVAPEAHYYGLKNDWSWPWAYFEVFKETPEGLVAVACPVSGGGFAAETGATYLIMVSRITNDWGWVAFTMEDKGEPFLLEVTVDPVGKANPKTGAATIGGAFKCSQPANIHISTELRQTLGRKTIIYANSYESGQNEFTCSGEGAWSQTLRSSEASFGGGVAEVHVMASACGPANCQSADFMALTKLKGGK